MQLAVEEKCEFLPFLSPKKVFMFLINLLYLLEWLYLLVHVDNISSDLWTSRVTDRYSKIFPTSLYISIVETPLVHVSLVSKMRFTLR